MKSFHGRITQPRTWPLLIYSYDSSQNRNCNSFFSSFELQYSQFHKWVTSSVSEITMCTKSLLKILTTQAIKLCLPRQVQRLFRNNIGFQFRLKCRICKKNGYVSSSLCRVTKQNNSSTNQKVPEERERERETEVIGSLWTWRIEWWRQILRRCNLWWGRGRDWFLAPKFKVNQPILWNLPGRFVKQSII